MLGHRNHQGLAFASDGTLYSNEHGPDTDDEINVITAGSNYGWPHVAGYQDDHFYVYARWADATEPCDELHAIGPSTVPPDRAARMKILINQLKSPATNELHPESWTPNPTFGVFL